jgi:hypothetical protein
VDVWVDTAAVLAAKVVRLAADVAILAANRVGRVRAVALEELLWADRYGLGVTLCAIGVESWCHL